MPENYPRQNKSSLAVLVSISWLVLISLRVFSAATTSTVEAFINDKNPSFSRAKRRLNKSLVMSVTMEDDNAVETKIPNWRVIPADAEDYAKHLHDRAYWSPTQLKESLALYEKLISCQDEYVAPCIKDALNSLDHAFRLYGAHSVICSFNGGKDAVAILHLLRAAHAKHYNSTGETPIRPRVIYFEHEDEFPEVIGFLEDSVKQYDLEMLAFTRGVGFGQGLKILVENNQMPGSEIAFPMAFVLGTRSNDPNAKGQDRFAPSSHYMPPFMRVNPVLEWTYGHIWHFLRLFHLPYCSLYDQGYTSLGTTKDTLPCPALAVNGEHDNSGSGSLPKYWPAYMLRDWDQERAGRIKKDKKGKSTKKHKDQTRAAAVPTTPSSKAGSGAGSVVSTISDLMKSDDPINMNVVTGPIDEASSSSLLPADEESTVFTLEDCDGTQKSVGLLVIGDEILKGLTVDQNTNAAAKALRRECVNLRRVVVVSDDQDEIVKEIHQLQKQVDVIVSSGGVGPTHDDVTIKSVAAALGRNMTFHQGMADLLLEKMGNKDLTEAQRKMAMLPDNSKLRYLSTNEHDWPVLQCRNIFVLPGVPEFFSEKIQNVATYLSSQLERSVAYKVVLSVDEASIVDTLNAAVVKHPNVTFGSYPFVSHPEYKTVLTLEGSLLGADDAAPVPEEGIKDQQTARKKRNSSFVDALNATILPKDQRDRYVRLALDDLINELPKGSILRVENDDLSPFS
jgi:FAD synthetase